MTTTFLIFSLRSKFGTASPFEFGLGRSFIKKYIERTEHEIIVSKPANKYQIIEHYHNFKNILISNY